MPCWRSGLTHIPLKDTCMGSNPIQGTILKQLGLIVSLDNYIIIQLARMIL